MSFAPVLMHSCLRGFYKQNTSDVEEKMIGGNFDYYWLFFPKTFNHQRQTNKKAKKQQQQTNKQNN